MTLKKRVLLAVVPIALLVCAAYFGIQFIAGLWRTAQAQPLPAITIEAKFPGASASVVADCVAAPIEQQVNGVERMVSMRSRSGNDGSYSLTVTFERGTDLDIAQALVTNRVELAMPILPAAVQRDGLTTKKKSPGIALIVNLSSPDGSRDSTYLSNYAAIQIRDELSRLVGVSDIVLVGKSDWRMRIEIDVKQLAARDLALNDVVEAIRQQNVAVGGGIGKPLPPAKALRLPAAGQAGDIIVKVDPGGRIHYLKDVARIETGDFLQNTAHLNGKPAASLFIYALPQANLRELRANFKARLAQLSERFPAGISLDVAFDFTTNLQRNPGVDHLWLDVSLAANAAPERTIAVLHRAEKILRSMEPVWDVLELTGSPFAPLDEQGCILVRLEEASRSAADRAEIMRAIRGRMAKEILEAKFRLRDLSGTGRLPPGNYPLRLAVRGPDQDKVRAFAAKLVERLCQSVNLTDVSINLESVPCGQLFAEINRDKSGELGVMLEEINQTFTFWLGAAPIDGFDYIDVRCSGALLDLPARAAQMKHVMVRNNAGKLVPLGAFVKLREVQSPRVIHRLDLAPMEEITANPAPGVSLAEARSSCTSLANAVHRELGLTKEYRVIGP